MKSVKRILCLVLALCIMLSMSACFKEERAKKTIVDNVYKVTTHKLPEGFSYVNLFVKTRDGYLISGETYDEETSYYTTKYATLDENLDFIEYIDIVPSFEEGTDAWINSLSAAEDGTYWMLLNTSFYDEETGYYESDNLVIRLDPDFNVINMKSVRDILGVQQGEYAYIYNLIPLNDIGVIAMNDNDILIIDTDLNIAAKKPISDFNGAMYLNSMISSPVGIVVAYSDPEWKNKAVILDPITLDMSDEYDFSNVGYGNYYTGFGEYDFFYSDDSGIYGYSFDKQESVELMNYMNSDLQSFYPSSLFAKEDYSFLSVGWDPEGGDEMCILELTPVPDEEAVPKYIITLGCLYLNYRIREQIYKFNRTSDEYRIVLKDYSENINYDTDSNYTYEDAIAKMNSDIASGDVPDLFVCTSELPFDSYASKGLFEDLYQYIDSEPDFSREDFEANVLKAYETNGKLYRISPLFSVQGFIGLESVIGEYAENWNTDAFLALANSLPEGSTMFQDMTRSTMLDVFMNGMYSEFVDVNTGKCTFDDGRFAALLEYTKTLNEQSIYETIDWDMVDDSFWEEMNNAIPEGRVALSTVYTSSFSDIMSWINYTYKTDEIIFVGYPSMSGRPVISDENGSIAISSQSKVKDGAWAFVKSLLSKEYQDSFDWELPIRTSSLLAMMEKQVKQAQEQKKQDEENPTKDDVIVAEDFSVMPRIEGEIKMAVVTENVKLPVGETILIDPDNDGVYEKSNYLYLDEHYANIMLEYIRSADRIIGGNSEVMKMIREEAQRFFEDKCTSAQAASALQSRASLYISESR